MSDAIRSGTVESIEQAAKGPWKAKVGGRVVRFWPNQYESTEPTEIREMLEGAIISGLAVEVSGVEEDIPGRDNKSFMAKGIRIMPAASQPTNGSQKPSDGSGGQKFVGREPDINDFWVAARCCPKERQWIRIESKNWLRS